MLQTLNFNVVEVEFQCCRHVMLIFVSRWRVRRAPNVRCCTQHGSQHGRKIVATWSQHGREKGERLLMLNVGRNMLATFTCWSLDLTADD
jgi:hypothetical protein